MAPTKEPGKPPAGASHDGRSGTHTPALTDVRVYTWHTSGWNAGLACIGCNPPERASRRTALLSPFQRRILCRVADLSGLEQATQPGGAGWHWWRRRLASPVASS